MVLGISALIIEHDLGQDYLLLLAFLNRHIYLVVGAMIFAYPVQIFLTGVVCFYGRLCLLYWVIDCGVVKDLVKCGYRSLASLVLLVLTQDVLQLGAFERLIRLVSGLAG